MHNKKLCSLVSRTHLTNLHSLDYTLTERIQTRLKGLTPCQARIQALKSI